MSIRRLSGLEIRNHFNWHLKRLCQVDPHSRPDRPDPVVPSLPAGLAILAIANGALTGLEVSPRIFNRINFAAGLNPEQAAVLAEIMSKVNGAQLKLTPPEKTAAGQFTIQFNPIRGARPLRDAQNKEARIDAPFEPRGFSYLSVNRAERFISTQIGGQQADFFFNMFPFAPYHFVLVPGLREQHNQHLSDEGGFAERAVSYAWALVSGAEDPDIRLAFNTLGAHASVNHFHFQGFFAGAGWVLPVDEHLRERGSLEGWALRHAAFIPASDPAVVQRTLAHIRRLHELYARGEKVAYNLYFSPAGIAIFPRRHQGHGPYFEAITEPIPGGTSRRHTFTTGFAFYELLGEVICPRQDYFNRFRSEELGGRDIQAVFNALSLDKNPFAGLS